ncbi:hypothetical protein GCM10028820_19950 [Tessaracoccus terricola]
MKSSTTGTGRRATALLGVVALLLSLLAINPAPAAAAENLVTNGTFDDVDATTGLPAGWTTWAPAGTTTFAVEPTAGPVGDRALRISAEPASDLTARRALVQHIAIDDTTPRTLRLTGYIKGEGLASTNWTSIRLQGRDAANSVTIPVAYHGRSAGTFGWTAVDALIAVPEGTTRLSIEPMLDRSGGTVWFADIALEAVDATNAGLLNGYQQLRGASAAVLEWNFGDVVADSYAIHRAEGETEPALDGSAVIRTSFADRLADETVAAGSTHTYVVEALAADGTSLGRSNAVTVTISDEVVNRQLLNVISAFAGGDGVRLDWSLNDAALAGGDVTVRAGASEGAAVTDVATVPAADGGITLPAGTGPYLELVQAGTVLDRTVAGTSAHPRAMVTEDQLADVRERIANDPTTKAAWEDLLRRVETNDYSGGASQMYRARDAAFAYAVTGEQSYAQQAHEFTMADADWVTWRATNNGLELGRAQLLLAAIYDWGHNGFTEEQRADVRRLISEGSDIMTADNHDNLEGDDKASNWVAVASTTELAALLSARGDADFGLHHERINYLSNLVRQHLQQGYTDTGYTQEGWDYFHYAGLYMLPSALAAIGSGHVSLADELERPDFWNLALHSLSARESLDMVQWGVGTPRNQSQGIMPMLFPITPDEATSGLQWLYDTTRGLGRSDAPIFDGAHNAYTVLFYPGGKGDPAELTAPTAHRAIIDDGPGFYAFRNGFTGADDVMATLNNRNSQHKGWSGSETFGLSLMGYDTTWALMAGKGANPLDFSITLVDGQIQERGQYSTTDGRGVTLDSKAYEGQGGGYVHLDGSLNYGVESAIRQAVVDMGNRDVTVLAFNDTFADAESHTWDWQVNPGDDVTIHLAHPSGADFVLTSAGGAVTGCVVGDGEVTIHEGNTLRVTQVGTEANFRIVMAVAADVVAIDCADTGVVTVDGRTLDLADLGSYDPAPAPQHPAYDANTVYDEGDVVSHDGKTWVAQWWTKGAAPGSSLYGSWMEQGELVPSAGDDVRAWTASWVYTGGETVAHDGHLWQAKWWTRNQVPGTPYGPWQDLGTY